MSEVQEAAVRHPMLLSFPVGKKGETPDIVPPTEEAERAKALQLVCHSCGFKLEKGRKAPRQRPACCECPRVHVHDTREPCGYYEQFGPTEG